MYEVPAWKKELKRRLEDIKSRKNGDRERNPHADEATKREAPNTPPADPRKRERDPQTEEAHRREQHRQHTPARTNHPASPEGLCRDQTLEQGNLFPKHRRF